MRTGDQVNLEILDKQMIQWGTKLRDDIKILPKFTNTLATTITSEITVLSDESKRSITASSPIDIAKRKEELIAFQGWMDFARVVQNIPFVTRAQIITEIYICFVYLGESWFKLISKNMDTNSVTKKCCKYLTDNPIRAFRNAIAHANWKYKSDFSAIEFWARKGQDENEPLSQFTISQGDLDFSQSLARCVAYASFLGLMEPN